MHNTLMSLVSALIVLILSVVYMFLGNVLEAIYLAIIWAGMTNNIGWAARND